MGGGGVAKGVSRCCKQHANTAGVAFLFRKVVKTVSRKKHNKPTGRRRLVPRVNPPMSEGLKAISSSSLALAATPFFSGADARFALRMAVAYGGNTTTKKCTELLGLLRSTAPTATASPSR